MMSDSFKTLPLSEVLEKIVGGGTPSKAVKRYYEGQIPWVTVKDLSDIYIDDTVDHITEEAIKNSSSNYIEEGQVIIATRMALGKAFINKKGVAINQDLKALYSKKFIDNHYLLYSLLQKEKKIKAMGSGTTVKGIRLDNLKSLPIGIPPLKEQQKIAAILSSVDEAIEKTEQIIEQTETVKKGLMQQLLTKGIGHTEFKDTPIGKIPLDWEISTIEQVSKVNPDALSNKTDDLYEVNYIDIASIEDNNITKTDKYLFKNAPSRARRIVQTGDIIVSTVRPYLKGFTYIDEKFNNYICSTGFSVLRTNNRCKSSFLYQVILSNHFINYMISNMTGSNYPAVNSGDVKKYKFPLPPLDEQSKISEILGEYDIKIKKENKRLLKLKLIKQGLMQQLLTGKVRVPINEDEEVPS